MEWMDGWMDERIVLLPLQALSCQEFYVEQLYVDLLNMTGRASLIQICVEASESSLFFLSQDFNSWFSRDVIKKLRASYRTFKVGSIICCLYP